MRPVPVLPNPGRTCRDKTPVKLFIGQTKRDRHPGEAVAEGDMRWRTIGALPVVNKALRPIRHGLNSPSSQLTRKTVSTLAAATCSSVCPPETFLEKLLLLGRIA